MWKELKERLKFFGEIIGNLIIDALFLSAWVVIDYMVGYIIAKFYTVEEVPPYIKFPKYVLDYAPPPVILCFVLADVLRSLRKLYDLVIGSLRGRKQDSDNGETSL